MRNVRSALVSVAALAALVLAACGGGDDGGSSTQDEIDQEKAIAIVVSLRGDEITTIPVFNADYNCTLAASGPQADQIEPVAARCRYDAEKQEQESQWRITFRETWSCDDFKAEAPGYPPCVGQTGFHEWTYLVDLRERTSELIDERGQFAPNMIT